MMAMKNQLMILACWLSLVIPSGAIRAQDTNRVPDLNKGVDAVDASVHAGVDEITLQDPQPSQETLKPPTTSSHWGFASSGQPPATQYWPARASLATSSGTQSDGKTALAPTSPSFQAGGQQPPSTRWSARPGDPSLNSSIDRNTGNPATQLSPFNNLSPSPAKNALARPERFRTDAPPLSTQRQFNGSSSPSSSQPQVNGISSPFSSRPQSDGISSPFSSRSESDGFSSPFSPQTDTDGFSSPFVTQQLESNSTRTVSPHSFSQSTLPSKRNRAEVKPRVGLSHKTPAANRVGIVAGFQSKPEKSAHSRITNKVD
jgi:hypothetical protein